jgi:hypothetical protein
MGNQSSQDNECKLRVQAYRYITLKELLPALARRKRAVVEDIDQPIYNSRPVCYNAHFYGSFSADESVKHTLYKQKRFAACPFTLRDLAFRVDASDKNATDITIGLTKYQSEWLQC